MGAIFSKLTSNLTNAGVTQPGPNGQTTFYPATPDATSAENATTAASKQLPSADAILGPDVLSPNTAVPPLPKVVQPSFADGNANGSFTSPALTTKGKLLSAVLTAGMGAAAGAAASVPTNPHISPGVGPGALAGLNLPFQLKQQREEIANEDLAQQEKRAQIAALPIQQQTELGLKRAQTQWYDNRGDAVGLHSLKPGDILVDKDGNTVGNGADVQATAQAKQSGKEAGTASAVTTAGGTPAQVLSALGVKNPSQKNVTLAQMYLDANNNDPGAAIKSLNADRLKNATSLHQVIASLRSTTAADNEAVKSDPQYSGLLRQRDALLTQAARHQAEAEFDPESTTFIQGLQSQADALTQKLIARRAQIAKPTAGNGTVQPPAQSQQFTHVSGSGKYAWNGTQWVPTGR